MRREWGKQGEGKIETGQGEERESEESEENRGRRRVKRTGRGKEK